MTNVLPLQDETKAKLRKGTQVRNYILIITMIEVVNIIFKIY